MLNVYFTASTSHNGEFIEFYKKILKQIKKNRVNLVSGNQVAIESILKQDKDLTPEQIYERERSLINEADVVIVEGSKPSLGVGSEIVYALTANKPVLVLVQTGFEDKISPIVAGNPSENLYIEYYHPQSVAPIVSRFIKNIKKFIKHKQILKQPKGKFIVIDGGDGSGKTTQTRLLVNKFKKSSLPVKYYDFPQYYSSFHGKTVAKFLRGEFGSIKDVSPYLASLSYALDRASVKKEMEDFLARGGTIIANRYATSNLAHQGAKFKNLARREEFLKWLYELEYKIHKIPKENIVIYLYVPWRIGAELNAREEDKKYLKGKPDIAETSQDHRIRSEKMYLTLVAKNRHWVKVNCVKDNKILPKEVIHQKIMDILKKKGYLAL